MGRIIKTLLIVSIVIFNFSFFSPRGLPRQVKAGEAGIFHLQKVFAQAPCQSIYGGGIVCIKTQDITVDSKILNPGTNKMVDSLSVNDAKYKSGFIVIFQVAITNNRKTVIEKTNLQDIFPQFVSFSSGPGSFDTGTRTLAFDVDNLMPSETRTINILGRIVDENQLSFSENVICLANQVIAIVPDPAAGQDNSQLCIEKKIGGFPIFPPVPVTSTPSTGPQSLALFSLIPMGIAGFFLRRKSK